MEYYLDQLPEIIIRRIKEYTPKDEDMKSPTSSPIKSLLHYYNYDYDMVYYLNEVWEEQHGNSSDVYDVELFYEPRNNEPFYKYALRICKKEKEELDTYFW